MWQIGAVLDRAAQDPDSRPAVPSDWEYRQYLNLPDDFYAPPQPGEQIIDLAQDSAGPYFQWLQAIENVQHLLPKLYGPSEWALERLRSRETAVIPSPRPKHLTACHVRRTDYLEHSDRFPQLTPKYFQEGLRRIVEEQGGTYALIFSDDPQWCEQNLDWFRVDGLEGILVVGGHVRPIPPRDRAAAGLPDDILDLWIFSGCDAQVIGNSTFSWWSAFLGEQKRVFYPDRWYGGDSQHHDRMWEAFPPDWRQLPC